VYFTAHLDHPAFVVERFVGPRTLELSFRGGVMAEYFKDARVTVYDARDRAHGATLAGVCRAASNAPASAGTSAVFDTYLAELDGEPGEIALGDVATWEVPPAEVKDDLVHTLACDDLAAAAAALSAFDVLRRLRRENGALIGDVRLLFTRAEEIGFVGAIAATRNGTIPREARLLALENSRSFAESPINGGPIVRVGDRISVFTPALTDAVAQRAEEIAGGPAQPLASQKQSDLPAWRWQRKLMSGGACEASVFCHAGFEATCVCLPLGNYHNMADLDRVQAGTNTEPPRVAREYIGVHDYHGLVDLLVACGMKLGSASNFPARVEKLWRERSFVLS
jgi:endoglucanase